MKPTLMVLAAGMGSRYGGIKQIEAVGPKGEIILEYSVYDAIRAGFGKVVFVIRRDIEQDFTKHVLPRFAGKIETACVFQDLTDLPEGYSVPAGRAKPWGTGHAVLRGRAEVHTPFAVINADDFYGAQGFEVMARQLMATNPAAVPAEFCMVAYHLQKTVSEHGSVSRGLCHMDAAGYLTDVVEHTKISCTQGRIRSELPDGSFLDCTGRELVSMNLFGFTPAIFPVLETQFKAFLDKQGHDPKAELYIPFVANEMIQKKQARLKVLDSAATWYGITYREDLPMVRAGLEQLTAGGHYPRGLWA